jgi:uncharacterized membrane protein YobD (UPF0266 family)
MEDYGYKYNRFAKEIRKFATTNTVHIKKETETNSYLYIIIICIILFCVLFKYA